MSKDIQKGDINLCPHCGQNIDEQMHSDPDAIPSQNDLSVCNECGGWGKFDENLKVVLLTPEDIAHTSPALKFEMDQISATIKANKKKPNPNLN